MKGLLKGVVTVAAVIFVAGFVLKVVSSLIWTAAAVAVIAGIGYQWAGQHAIARG